MKKVLAGIGIAGLITGVGLWSTGCQSADKKDKTDTEIEAKSSCGQGMEADSAKGSCGQGSCGQGSCGQDTAKQDTTAKSSCSK